MENTVQQDETLPAPTQLAWADDNDEDNNDEAPQQRSWVTTVLLGTALVAVGAAVWLWALSLSHLAPVLAPSPPDPSAPTTSVAAPDNPSALPTVPDVQGADIDSRFIATLHNHNLFSTTESDSDMVADAHVVCTYAQQGYTANQIATSAMHTNTALSASDAWFVTNLALDTYCPAFKR